MKKKLRAWIWLGLLLFLLFPLLQKTDPYEAAFKALPVQAQGRIKPIDTLARTSLLQLVRKQKLVTQTGETLSPAGWLLRVLVDPKTVDAEACFYVNHPELLSFLGHATTQASMLSYKAIQPYFKQVYQTIESIKEPLSAFDKQLQLLSDNIGLYQNLKYSLSFSEFNLASWLDSIPAGRQAIQAKERGQSYNVEAMARFIQQADYGLHLASKASIGLAAEGASPQWSNIGQLYLDCLVGDPHPILLAYKQLIEAYQSGHLQAFQQAAKSIGEYYQPYASVFKLKLELICNELAIFYKLALLYLGCFLCVLAYWVLKKDGLYQVCIEALSFTFIVHTGALLLRMYLQGRPPVTNLYSSAVFVAWAAAGLCLGFERFHKNGFMACVAAMVGSLALIVAHHLSLGEDTLEVMRAVLDSNFWLSTHVITVSLGYSAMFVSGCLGMLYVFQGLFKSKQSVLDALSRMAYGTVCFALLFSFIGTMLGGLWADMSWGRFWGWDPKENGALLIILWCAIMLHARIARVVEERGFMLFAIGGNIVTAWSWFGTNMLGVGLHSYGFMDKAFTSLAYFVLSQLCCIGLGFFVKGQG